MPADLAVQQLALARVQPRAHLEAEVAHPFGDRAGAAYGPGRSVEAGEEPVARRVELPSPEAHTSALQSPDQLVCRLVLETKNKEHHALIRRQLVPFRVPEL